MGGGPVDTGFPWQLLGPAPRACCPKLPLFPSYWPSISVLQVGSGVLREGPQETSCTTWYSRPLAQETQPLVARKGQNEEQAF